MADPDTGELEVVPERRQQEPLDDLILNELERIRYRLGVLVFWFVALPILTAIVAVIVAVIIANNPN